MVGLALSRSFESAAVSRDCNDAADVGADCKPVRPDGEVIPWRLPTCSEHGFNNDTTPRFDKAGAALAWSRTPALFKRTLS